jgi:hypothetical protein
MGKKAYGADRKVISRWRRRYREEDNMLRSLVPYSPRPNRLRKSKTDCRVIEKIKEVRMKHPKLSKYKIKIFIDEYCREEGIKGISVSSIGIIIKKKGLYNQLDGREKIHRKHVRKKKGGG